MPTPKLYTKEELVNRLYWGLKSQPEPLTRKELCEMIGRKKSPHIITVIEGLAHEGYFKRIPRTNARGTLEYTYATTAKA